MKSKEFILEIFRETDFINETVNWDSLSEPAASQLRQSVTAINKACSAFLNGQDTDDAGRENFCDAASKWTFTKNLKSGVNSHHRRSLSARKRRIRTKVLNQRSLIRIVCPRHSDMRFPFT
jgi:hypothetical protein